MLAALYLVGVIMKKALLVVSLLSVIAIISGLLFIKYGLASDRRSEIAEALFLKDGKFDHDLFSYALNRKFPLAKFSELKGFVEFHGGSCSGEISCTLNVYSTICWSSAIDITLNSNGSFNVEPRYDGC